MRRSVLVHNQILANTTPRNIGARCSMSVAMCTITDCKVKTRKWLNQYTLANLLDGVAISDHSGTCNYDEQESTIMITHGQILLTSNFNGGLIWRWYPSMTAMQFMCWILCSPNYVIICSWKIHLSIRNIGWWHQYISTQGNKHR